ncbi:MAG: universal stress protein [Bacteroidia bacterium]|nr:universal stress protein [Bacteroidia bacterium]
MKTILIATDFSPASVNAADYALELAKYFDTKLILLNAYPVPAANYDTGLPADIITALHKSSEDALSELKARLSKNGGAGLTIECLSVMGGTMDVIEEECKQKKVDLAVMGIVGEAGKIKEHIIGSTSLNAARHLEVPLFIIPDGAKYKRIHKLSFACDMDHTEETTTIYTAKYFAKIFDAELEVISIENPEEERSIEKAASLDFVEEKLEHVNHKTFLLADKDAAAGLGDHYANYPADIIILNPKKHNIFQTLFGTSVTKKLIFHSKIPLLVIH